MRPGNGRNLAYFNLLLNQQLDTIDEFKAAVLQLDANRVQLAAAQEAQEKDRASLTQTRAKLVRSAFGTESAHRQVIGIACRDGKQVAALAPILFDSTRYLPSFWSVWPTCRSRRIR